MKTSIGKRIGSGILALAITASMYVGGSVSVFAGDTLPYLGDSAKGENQPYQHGAVPGAFAGSGAFARADSAAKS